MQNLTIILYEKVLKKCSVKLKIFAKQAGSFLYHESFELNEMGDNFFKECTFFSHRFLKENLFSGGTGILSQNTE